MKQANNICKVPFGFIEIFGNGDVYTCCPAYIYNGCVGNIFKQPFLDIINSERAMQIRKNSLENDYSMCNLDLCSPNTMPFADQLDSKYIDNINYNTVLEKVNVIKFSYDLDCQIRCKSCRDNTIRNSKEYIEELDDKARKYFLPIIKYTNKVCLIGSGDPLASKHTRNFIKMIVEEYPHIKFDLHTNGLLLNEKMLTELNIIDKLSVIQVSIHSATKETYNKIILDGNFDVLMDNLKYISNLKNENKIEKLHLNFVVSNANLGDAKEFVSLANKFNAKAYFWTVRNAGTEYSIKEANNDLKLFKIFKDEIFKYPSVYLNPHIFNIIDNDNFIEEYINNQINELYSQIDLLTNLINKIVNTLAWWIPIRKWRENFRNKFFDNFIGGGINDGFKFLYPLNFGLNFN